MAGKCLSFGLCKETVKESRSWSPDQLPTKGSDLGLLAIYRNPPKSQKISFAYNICYNLKNLSEILHNADHDTAMLYAKFHRDPLIREEDVNKWNFMRFELKTELGWILHIVTDPWMATELNGLRSKGQGWCGIFLLLANNSESLYNTKFEQIWVWYGFPPVCVPISRWAATLIMLDIFVNDILHAHHSIDMKAD